MLIDINDEVEALDETNKKLLKDVLEFAAQKLNIDKSSEISLSIVDNLSIQQLNKRYRGLDVPTDVLSFPIDNDTLNAHSDIPKMLGDIIISIDKVVEQQVNYEHSFERELTFLTIHGLLHLLGYTHENSETEKIMFNTQKKILEGFGLER